MNPWSRFKLSVRRKETPFHARVHAMARSVRGFSVPVIPGLHRFLYAEWATRTSAWHNFWRVLYYEPMFKSACRAVGPGFKLWYAGNGICRILGNLQIFFGKNVHMFDNITLVGVRVYDEPEFHVGDNTYLGPAMTVLSAQSIRIGRWNLFSHNITIADNPSHPHDALLRLAPGGGLPPENTIRPVGIGDFCMFGPHCFIYPGTTVGDGVFARAGTHLSGDIPPFALVGGNPARILKLLPIAPEFRALVGEERFKSWIEQRRPYGQADFQPEDQDDFQRTGREDAQ